MNMITMPLWAGIIVLFMAIWSVYSVFVIIRLSWKISRMAHYMPAGFSFDDPIEEE